MSFGSRLPLVSQLPHTRIELLLHVFVAARSPGKEGAQSRCELPLPRFRLRLAEGGAIHLSRLQLQDQQADAETFASRNLLSGCQHQRTRRLGLTRSPTPAHAVAALAVTCGTKQPFSYALERAIPNSPDWNKVVDHQQRVLG
jgi:hypothetical protein